MPQIEHFTPETLDEAAALIMAADAPVPALAEGTRLVLQAIDGQPSSTFVIDVERIPELNRLEYDERGGLRVGAAVSYASILEFPPVRRLYPILADAGETNRPEGAEAHSTLGMILGNAPPFAGCAPALICLRASATIFGPHGWSELGVEALLPGSRTVSLQPGEFVVDVRLPAPPPRSGGAYLRSSPQDPIDRVVTGIGVFLVMEEDLVTCCGARIVLGPVAGTTALRILEVERFLAGKRLQPATLEEAATLAVQSVGREKGAGGGSTPTRLEAIAEAAHRTILEALARAHKAAAT